MIKIINYPQNEKERNFSQAFNSRLYSKGPYDIQKRGTFDEVISAFLVAGKTIDPNFVEKLHHLHKNGFTLNQSMLLLIRLLEKNGNL